MKMYKRSLSFALKQYAEEKNLKWGFVRDKDGELYINNTEHVKDMADENWKPIDDVVSGDLT